MERFTMGYLRKKSFLIFSDENAPTEVTTLDPQEVAKIEAAHQEGKQGRIEELILKELTPTPSISPEESRLALGTADRASREDSGDWDLFASEEEKQAQRKAQEEAFAEQQAADRAKVEEAKKAAEEIGRKKAAGPEGDRLRRIVQRVQEAGGIEDQVKKFIQTNPEMTGTANMPLREFAHKVFEIDTSKPELPDTRYIPSRSKESTVRFKDDQRIGVNVIGRTNKRVDGEQVAMTQTEIINDQNPTLWVKVADGAWSKDGNWGGHLQVTCATAEGKWIGSSDDGWVTPVASKGDPITFYDMGNYYEIWQKDRETGRPMIVEDKYLRFVQGATPGKFNLQDSTWD
ncbi:hypothetical protein [Streptomyces sp. NPDC091268]|uniref:hypothetical protein n=1 Tax=Streptomyces sp. NPDC091268 TaxID=3365979 RepID=UPI003805F908